MAQTVVDITRLKDRDTAAAIDAVGNVLSSGGISSTGVHSGTTINAPVISGGTMTATALTGGTVNVTPGSTVTATTFHPAGLLTTTSATAATTTGTTEQTLATYNLPANALDVAGRRLRIYASFSAAANGNNKTFKLYFGSSLISSGVLTTNAKNGWADLMVVKTGASTQIVSGRMVVDTTSITPYVNASSAETDTAAIVIKFTGTDGTSSAADIVLNDFFVEYSN